MITSNQSCLPSLVLKSYSTAVNETIRIHVENSQCVFHVIFSLYRGLAG